jgi:hypothetical protein
MTETGGLEELVWNFFVIIHSGNDFLSSVVLALLILCGVGVAAFLFLFLLIRDSRRLTLPLSSAIYVLSFSCMSCDSFDIRINRWYSFDCAHSSLAYGDIEKFV